MTYNAPMELLLGGRRFGWIASYGYDQPWAMGRLEADDPPARDRLAAASSLLAEVEEWPEAVTAAADERRWEQALARLGIDPGDVALLTEGPWSVRMLDGHERPVQIQSFGAEGFVTWRW